MPSASSPNSTDRDPAEPSVGELFLDLAADLQQMFLAGCAEIGLTYMEARTLRHAARRRAQAALVHALDLAPTRVSALLGALERKGLITRSKSRGDHRQRMIELTARGRAAIDRLDAHVAEHSLLVRALDDEQFARLRSILLTMRRARPSSQVPVRIAADGHGSA